MLGQDDMPRQLEYEDDDTGWDREFAGWPRPESPRCALIQVAGEFWIFMDILRTWGRNGSIMIYPR